MPDADDRDEHRRGARAAPAAGQAAAIGDRDRSWARRGIRISRLHTLTGGSEMHGPTPQQQLDQATLALYRKALAITNELITLRDLARELVLVAAARDTSGSAEAAAVPPGEAASIAAGSSRRFAVATDAGSQPAGRSSASKAARPAGRSTPPAGRSALHRLDVEAANRELAALPRRSS